MPKQLPIITCIVLLCFSAITAYGSDSSEPPFQQAEKNLTLAGALDLALKNNPLLKASSHQENTQSALKRQAGLRPNPELEVEVEDLAWEGGSNGFDTAAVIFSISQVIETGGKRAIRSRIADIEARLSGWDHLGLRLDVVAGTSMAFVNVLAAQKKLELAEELHQLVSRIRDVATERVRSGKVSPLEQVKADVEFSTSLIGLEQIKRDIAISQRALALTWGEPQFDFSGAQGDLDTVADVPPVEELLPLTAKNPDLARLSDRLELARMILEQERAGKRSDLEWSAGVQRFQETGEKAYIVGLGTELKVFDKNHGAVDASRHQVSKAEEECRAVELEVRTALLELHENCSFAYQEIMALREAVLPAAEQAFDAAREGYQQGKFEYLDVLDAQRTLFEAKDGYLEILASYHRNVAALERLIGQSF